MSLKATGPDRAVMSLKAPGSEALNTINYGKRGKKMNNKFAMLYLKQIFEETDPDELSNAQDHNTKIKDKPENFSADDKLENDDKKYSDADLDRIISQKFAKWQKEQDKKVSEATKLATMTEQERAEHERDIIKKELEDLKKANNLAEMGKQARKMLSDDGINIPDALVDLIISDDAETTKSTVQQFSKLFQSAVKAAVKEALKGNPPTTGSSGAITKDQIMKVKDRAERQRLIRENMNLFKQ